MNACELDESHGWPRHRIRCRGHPLVGGACAAARSFNQVETVVRETPKVRVSPRRLLLSWYASRIRCFSSSVYPFGLGFSRKVRRQARQRYRWTPLASFP